MKIMMVGSIRNSAQSSDILSQIVEILETDGHHVLHEHVTQKTQTDLNAMSANENSKFHSDILKKIKSSDIIVSECSNQSLSVGYLLSYAAEMGKPVVIFYSKESPKPNLFPTLTQSGKFFVVAYQNKEELPALVTEYVDYAQEQIDVRFNFFISPAIGNYLNWISKEKKIPRSVYLRTLIEKDMEDNNEYNA